MLSLVGLDSVYASLNLKRSRWAGQGANHIPLEQSCPRSIQHCLLVGGGGGSLRTLVPGWTTHATEAASLTHVRAQQGQLSKIQPKGQHLVRILPNTPHPYFYHREYTVSWNPQRHCKIIPSTLFTNKETQLQGEESWSQRQECSAGSTPWTWSLILYRCSSSVWPELLLLPHPRAGAPSILP